MAKKSEKKNSKKAKEPTTTKKTAKKGGRGGAFDMDKMEVLGLTKLGDGVKAQVYSYDGGPTRMNFIMETGSGKTVPVRKLNRKQVETLVEKSKRILGFFPKDTEEDDGSDDE